MLLRGTELGPQASGTQARAINPALASTGVFAQCDSSLLGMAALEYCKGLLRIASVRVLPLNGGLSGVWAGYSRLLVTPMTGPYVNCVACDPARWTWLQAVPASSRDIALTADGGIDLPDANEIVKGRCELYTSGVRNILFAAAGPRGRDQITSALKYEQIVVPDVYSTTWWLRAAHRPTWAIETPIDDQGHASLRQVVCE